MKNNNYSVYVHKFPNGKNYVGLTKQSVEARWGFNGSGYKGQPVYNGIEEFGWDNIEHVILKDGLTFDKAQEFERQTIIEYDSINNGYNVSPGGGLGGNPWVKVEYKGKMYSPEELLMFSSVENLTSHDVTTRLSHGWDVEDILTKPKTRKNVTVEYKGKPYLYKELVKLSSVPVLSTRDLFNRVDKLGWDIDRALTQPKNVKLQPPGCRGKDRECLYEYNGKIYKTYELVAMSDVEGLNVGDITCRINQLGWSVEDAITKPKKRQNQQFEYRGKMYSSKELAALSPYDNISHHDITDRVNGLGWSVEDAVNRPKQIKTKKQ
jgi:hypothetical protein